MGWTYTHRDRGEATNLEWFRNEFRFTEGYELLDLAQGPRFVQYGAWRIPDGRVVGMVILTHWKNGDWYNFGYKEMDESSGPGEDECPERILALLTPHDGSENEWAREWRARCQANLEKRRSRPRLTKGSVVVFAEPLRFTDGSGGDTFAFVRRNTFDRLSLFHTFDRDNEGYELLSVGRVSISGWSQREYEVV